MTRHPHSVRRDEGVAAARQLMASMHVRHLPVLEAGEIVGVVNEEDVKHGDAGAKVEDVCVEPISVDIDTNLFLVAALLAEKRVGSVLVTERGHLAGIFTTTDACRVLAGLHLLR